MKALEHAEKLFRPGRVKANAIVGHRDDGSTIGVRAIRRRVVDLDHGIGIVLPELDRVRNQIDHHLLERAQIGADLGQS